MRDYETGGKSSIAKRAENYFKYDTLSSWYQARFKQDPSPKEFNQLLAVHNEGGLTASDDWAKQHYRNFIAIISITLF